MAGRRQDLLGPETGAGGEDDDVDVDFQAILGDVVRVRRTVHWLVSFLVCLLARRFSIAGE